MFKFHTVISYRTCISLMYQRVCTDRNNRDSLVNGHVDLPWVMGMN